MLNGAGLGKARLDKSRRGVNARPLPDCKDAKNEDGWKKPAKMFGELGHDWIYLVVKLDLCFLRLFLRIETSIKTMMTKSAREKGSVTFV